ncbi:MULTISPECIES: hypothetical protein [Amycolatopsis]|uniref:Uncharacterized protein n=1 Tax=Amycolatopsis dendrobii TaxID=2760662 RepID=A0A7W3ZBR1_9PSEU|nr:MULTISPECIES: hypothetical protein [Amycolatopsis]MBB1155535.1 hypothetical protein [Amycolatopsis dendrobii]UKD54527.1 hypothetical protein L3Q65_42845 [Amycolatopsis sp. FU40]
MQSEEVNNCHARQQLDSLNLLIADRRFGKELPSCATTTGTAEARWLIAEEEGERCA